MALQNHSRVQWRSQVRVLTQIDSVTKMSWIKVEGDCSLKRSNKTTAFVRLRYKQQTSSAPELRIGVRSIGECHNPALVRFKWKIFRENPACCSSSWKNSQSGIYDDKQEWDNPGDYCCPCQSLGSFFHLGEFQARSPGYLRNGASRPIPCKKVLRGQGFLRGSASTNTCCWGTLLGMSV